MNDCKSPGFICSSSASDPSPQGDVKSIRSKVGGEMVQTLDLEETSPMKCIGGCQNPIHLHHHSWGGPHNYGTHTQVTNVIARFTEGNEAKNEKNTTVTAIQAGPNVIMFHDENLSMKP